MPANTGIEPFTPAAAPATREVLVVRGTPEAVRVGGQPVQLQGNRLEIELPEGESRDIEITWAGATATEVFHLMFQNDRPTAAEVPAYSAGAPTNPTDPRFIDVSGVRPTDTVHGPAALRAWLDTLSNTTLELHAHASHDPTRPAPPPGTPDPDRVLADQQLSERRLQVARALIPARFNTSNGTAHGHTMSQANTIATMTPGGGPIDARNGGREEHRVTQITGTKAGVRTILRGRLARDRRQQGTTTPGTNTTTQPQTDRESTSAVQASFEINFEMIQRTEKIVASYSLSTRKARKVQKHPQGQLVLEGDGKRYILEADGAQEFFRKLQLAASTTAMWQQDGISAVQVQLRYAPRGDGGFQEIGEMFLTPDKLTDTFVRNLQRDKSLPGEPYAYWYEYRVTIHYLDDVALGDTLGAVTSVGAPGADAEGWIRSFARNLVIHPRDVTPALTVNLATGIMHFELIDRVQVVMGYGAFRHTLVLTAQDNARRLVIRPEAGAAATPIETSGTIFYKDGAQVALPEQQWQPQELVVINEPRGNTLRVQVILADPNHEFQSAQVRLRYEHGNRLVEQPVELVRHAQLFEWAVRLEDASARDWQYQATLIETSGAIRTIDWTDGKNDRLILGVQAVDVIPVTVTWLVPPPAGGLLAVKVDLEYTDPGNDVRWEHSELIRGDHSGTFTWAIAVKDASVRSYRYRVTEFRATGATEGQWQESNATALVLLPSA
ncbi:MAG: hypothetical protein U0168_29650 [Nannocystaceae bacterium]